MGNPITVGGNLQIQGCTGTAGGGVFNGYTQTNGPGLITIGGNFACQNNAGPCLGQDGGKVGGNVWFITNTGGAGNAFMPVCPIGVRNLPAYDHASALLLMEHRGVRIGGTLTPSAPNFPTGGEAQVHGLSSRCKVKDFDNGAGLLRRYLR
jgi:hypothetical protein